MRLTVGWETPVNRAMYLCFGGSSWAVQRLIFLMTSGERTDEALRFLAALAFCGGLGSGFSGSFQNPTDSSYTNNNVLQ